jgi:hypothetical protein
MKTSAPEITQLILDQLGRGEMRLLVLLVAIRKALKARSSSFKGDLPAAVNAALRKLVVSRTVGNTDGTYSLLPQAKGVVATY